MPLHPGTGQARLYDELTAIPQSEAAPVGKDTDRSEHRHASTCCRETEADRRLLPGGDRGVGDMRWQLSPVAGEEIEIRYLH